MTTVAYKDGILAADTRMVEGSLMYLGHKLRKLPDGRVYGWAGNARHEIEFASWLMGDVKKLSRWNKLDALLVEPDKSVWCFMGGNPEKMPVECDYAIGSGQSFAMAAMAMNLSAVEAVKFAGTLNPSTNETVEYYVQKTKRLVKAFQ